MTVPVATKGKPRWLRRFARYEVVISNEINGRHETSRRFYLIGHSARSFARLVENVVWLQTTMGPLPWIHRHVHIEVNKLR